MKELKKIKLTHIVLLIMAGVILLDGSLFNLIHNKKETHKLQKQRAELDAEYVRLGAELELLQKQDPQYLEELARGKYHMSKPSETEIRFEVK